MTTSHCARPCSSSLRSKRASARATSLRPSVGSPRSLAMWPSNRRQCASSTSRPRETRVARAQQVHHAMTHDATRTGERVDGKRIGRGAKNLRRVVSLREAEEQVLLQERVRKTKTIFARADEDMRALQRVDRARDLEPE